MLLREDAHQLLLPQPLRSPLSRARISLMCSTLTPTEPPPADRTVCLAGRSCPAHTTQAPQWPRAFGIACTQASRFSLLASGPFRRIQRLLASNFICQGICPPRHMQILSKTAPTGRAEAHLRRHGSPLGCRELAKGLSELRHTGRQHRLPAVFAAGQAQTPRHGCAGLGGRKPVLLPARHQDLCSNLKAGASRPRRSLSGATASSVRALKAKWGPGPTTRSEDDLGLKIFEALLRCA